MPPLHVALGDSISIDDYAGGPGCGGASLLFRNRDDDFPQWRGRDLTTRSPDTAFAMLASDGATVDTVERVQLPRLHRMGVRPTLVTLTVGGNDVLACYGDTGAARATVIEVAQGVSRTLEHVRGRLAPDGQVLVGTVYDPSDGTGDADRLGLPPWPDAVDVLAELNTALRRAATQHGAAVAEIAGTFLGHGVRAGDPRRPEPRPVQRDLWFCSVIEPNAWGADGVRAAFWDALSS